MLLIELNEFNYSLLKKSCKEKKLHAIEKLLNFKYSKTITSDSLKSGYLEPWVQWVSIHTGKPSKHHQIKNLGDIPNLRDQQIWEKLSKKKIKSIIWGPMNGSKGDSENTLIFLPDPWVFTENAYPNKFNNFLELPRYLAKNYLSISLKKLLVLFPKFILSIIKYLSTINLVKSFKIPFKGFYKFGFKNFIIIIWFEYLSSMIFLKLIKEANADFNLIFINSLAHLQHHYWKNKNKISPEILFGLDVINDILLKFFQNLDANQAILCVSGLSQNNSARENWTLYRWINLDHLLNELGITNFKTETLMSYDAHIILDTVINTKKTYSILKKVTINKVPLFYLELDKKNQKKIFIRINYSKLEHESLSFISNKKEFLFINYFKKIVKRTGKHSRIGTILYKNLDLPKELKNHEIFDLINKQFK